MIKFTERKLYMENQVITRNDHYAPNSTYNFQYVVMKIDQIKPKLHTKYTKYTNAWCCSKTIQNNPHQLSPDYFIWFKVILPNATLMQHNAFCIIMNRDRQIYKDTVSNDYTRLISTVQACISHQELITHFTSDDIHPHLISKTTLLSILKEP